MGALVEGKKKKNYGEKRQVISGWRGEGQMNIPLCLILGVISNSGPACLNDTRLKISHSFTQYRNSISQQRLSLVSHVLHLLTCQEVIHSSAAGKERVKQFGLWNVIKVIVSATELPQVSLKILLKTHRGNNVVRSNSWVKGNCEIFRSRKKKHEYLCRC